MSKTGVISEGMLITPDELKNLFDRFATMAYGHALHSLQKIHNDLTFCQIEGYAYWIGLAVEKFQEETKTVLDDPAHALWQYDAFPKIMDACTEYAVRRMAMQEQKELPL